jgi:hypothetical protein
MEYDEFEEKFKKIKEINNESLNDLLEINLDKYPEFIEKIKKDDEFVCITLYLIYIKKEFDLKLINDLFELINDLFELINENINEIQEELIKYDKNINTINIETPFFNFIDKYNSILTKLKNLSKNNSVAKKFNEIIKKRICKDNNELITKYDKLITNKSFSNDEMILDTSSINEE